MQNISNVYAGRSKSCGCKRPHKSKGYLRQNPIYGTWYQIIQRCTNPKHKFYKYYGGRGIGVFEIWKNSFLDFYNYIGNKPTIFHTIERIDNSIGYFPGNIKWATKKEQSENRRERTDRIFFEFNNIQYTLKQISELFYISYHIVKNSYYRKQFNKLENLIKQSQCQEDSPGQ